MLIILRKSIPGMLLHVKLYCILPTETNTLVTLNANANKLSIHTAEFWHW